MARMGYRELFKNRAFMGLWLGQVVSQLADRIIFVVFIAMIVSHFGSAESLKSYLYVAFTIPAILLTAVAGVFVDRWHRQRTLIATHLLRALVILTIPLAAQSHQLFGLYACAFFISVATQFFVPAESATIPMVVPKNQLMVANSLFTATMMGSLVFGFTLGDPLIEHLGLMNVHWAISALYVVGALFTLMVGVGTVKSESTTAVSTVFAEMKEGFAYLKVHTNVLTKMLMLAALFSTVISACILFVNLSTTFLFADPTVAARKFVWLVTFSGLGMVGGAIVLGRFCCRLRKSWLVYSGFMVVGLGALLLTLAPFFHNVAINPMVSMLFTWRVLYALVISTFLGVGASFIAIPLQSLLHEMIPEDKRGKVLGILFTLLSTCSTLPAVIAGVGTDWLGVMPMFCLMGVPIFLLGAGGLIRRRLAHVELMIHTTPSTNADHEGHVDADTW